MSLVFRPFQSVQQSGASLTCWPESHFHNRRNRFQLTFFDDEVALSTISSISDNDNFDSLYSCIIYTVLLLSVAIMSVDYLLHESSLGYAVCLGLQKGKLEIKHNDH